MVSCTSVAQLDYGDTTDTKKEKQNINYSRTDGKVIIRGENVIFQFFSSPRFKKPSRDRFIFDSEEDKKHHIASLLAKKYLDCNLDNDGNVMYDMDEYQECLQYANSIIESNKKKNRENSIRRSKNKVIEYAMCNPQLKYFLTLTYKENMCDYDVAYNDFRKFRNRINMMMKRKFNKKFEFVCIFERQKRGAWHMHMLCNLDYKDFCDFEVDNWNIGTGKCSKKTDDRKKVENILNSIIWDKGFIDYRELYDSQGSAFYISKYMTKETDLLQQEDKVKKRYLASIGLKKEIVKEFSIDSDDLCIESEKKITPCEAFNLLDSLKKQTENFDSSDNYYYFSESSYDDYISPVEKVQGVNRKVKEIKFYKNVNFK